MDRARSTFGVTRGIMFAVALCLVLTVAVEAVDFNPAIGNRRIHVALEAVDALGLIFLAAVLLGRLRSDGSRRNLLLMAGVVVVAAKNGFFAGAAMFAEDVPGDDPLVWGTAFSVLVGSGLLAAAGLLPDRRLANPGRWALLVVALAGATVVVPPLLVAGFDAHLPYAFPEVPADPATVTELDVLSGHPAKIAIDLITAACYAIAAIAIARRAHRSGDAFIAWLSIGCTFAAGAFVYYALIPSRFTELIYGGEILWTLAIISFCYGAFSEISNLEVALVRAAVMAERKRVARDLHDGIVQELAYISTQTGWLLGHSEGSELEPPIRRIRDAVDRALDESRGAIAALNRELNEPLHQAIGNAALDVATRAGIDLNLELDPESTAPAEWRDALIRIAREAVRNAARHGRATQVHLRLSGQPMVLTVQDNGTGFDPTQPASPQTFGIQSMRERTESLGGEFHLESTPSKGTTVQVSINPAETSARR